MIYHTVTLAFASCKVPVYIGQDVLLDTTIFNQHVTSQQVMIVTQRAIAKHYLAALSAALAPRRCQVVYLPAGEKHKQIKAWQHIIDSLVQARFDRSATLIALGGGIVGDITGFAAACFMRGIPYIQIPTTLIAQVDAAIGGKTAVNHALAKNLLGAVYQPKCVIIDINLLKTLPLREYTAGFAEVVKHGAALDYDFFCWLEQSVTALMAQDAQALAYAVYKSVLLKGALVTEDEHDHGRRQLLNFGHTLGHVLEAVTNYEAFLHGEAVAIGMVLAAKVSTLVAGLPVSDFTRLQQLLTRFALPIHTALPPWPKLKSYLTRDKKIRAGQLRFILLAALGEAFSTTTVSSVHLAEVLA